jgi:hypothetical protein
LNPEIKAVADRIYACDTKKFKRLVVWIKQAQKYNYSDPVIIGALLRFEPHAKTIDKGWYQYLDKIIAKVNADFNMGSSFREHERQNWDERELAKAFQLRALVK